MQQDSSIGPFRILKRHGYPYYPRVEGLEVGGIRLSEGPCCLFGNVGVLAVNTGPGMPPAGEVSICPRICPVFSQCHPENEKMRLPIDPLVSCAVEPYCYAFTVPVLYFDRWPGVRTLRERHIGISGACQPIRKAGATVTNWTQMNHGAGLLYAVA